MSLLWKQTTGLEEADDNMSRLETDSGDHDVPQFSKDPYCNQTPFGLEKKIRTLSLDSHSDLKSVESGIASLTSEYFVSHSATGQPEVERLIKVSGPQGDNFAVCGDQTRQKNRTDPTNVAAQIEGNADKVLLELKNSGEQSNAAVEMAGNTDKLRVPARSARRDISKDQGHFKIPHRRNQERRNTQCKEKKKKDRTKAHALYDLRHAFPDKDGDTLLHIAASVHHEASSSSPSTTTTRSRRRNRLLSLVRALGLRHNHVNAVNRRHQTPLHVAVAAANHSAIRDLLSLGATLMAQDWRGDTPVHTACRRQDVKTLRILLQMEGQPDAGGRRENGRNKAGAQDDLHIVAIGTEQDSSQSTSELDLAFNSDSPSSTLYEKMRDEMFSKPRHGHSAGNSPTTTETVPSSDSSDKVSPSTQLRLVPSEQYPSGASSSTSSVSPTMDTTRTKHLHLIKDEHPLSPSKQHGLNENLIRRQDRRSQVSSERQNYRMKVEESPEKPQRVSEILPKNTRQPTAIRDYTADRSRRSLSSTESSSDSRGSPTSPESGGGSYSLSRSQGSSWRSGEVKAALSVVNYEGLTSLHLGVLHCHNDIVQLLLQCGADVNAKDMKSGRTALHFAVDCPQPSTTLISTLLLHPHLNLDAANFAQQTALQLARGRHHFGLLDLLLAHGADWSDGCHGFGSSASCSDDEMDEGFPEHVDDLCRAGQLSAVLRQW